MRQSANRRWAAFRVYSFTAALVVAILMLPGLALAADSPNPHTSSSVETAACSSCHVPHVADGPFLTTHKTAQELCFGCHGAGSTVDVQSEIMSPDVKSSHALEGVQCSQCHTPHQGPAENNPSSIRVSNGATSGAQVCGSCHDEVVSKISTGHASIVVPDSAANISCLGCHDQHASTNVGLLGSKILVGTTAYEVTSQVDLCRACHAEGVAGIVSERTKHATVSEDTSVAVAGEGGSACAKCHDPHTGTVAASGDALCLECHAAQGLSYPAGYSFRGQTVYDTSSHSGLTSTNGFRTLGYDSAGFAVWESAGTTPTPSLPGTAVPSDEASKVVLIDGAMLETKLQTVLGGRDYQLYRFHVDAALSDLRTMRVQWAGQGTRVALWVWNAAGGSWDFLRTYSAADGQFNEITIEDPAGVQTASGEVWVLADAVYESEPTPRLATDYIGLALGYAGSESSGSCAMCHSMHGGAVQGVLPSGQVVASEGRLCTGDGGTGCHGVNSSEAPDIASKLAGASDDPRMSHDLMPEAQAADGPRIACSDCHNPHADNATSPYADPADISIPADTGLDALIAREGEARYAYVLVGAAHDATAPEISGVQVNVAYADGQALLTWTWTTDEHATSWVEWGANTAYGSSTGDRDALLQNHSVSATVAPDATYYYRIESADALGNPSYVEGHVTVDPAPAGTPAAEAQVASVSGGDSAAATWLLAHDPVQYAVPEGYSIDSNHLSLEVLKTDGTRVVLQVEAGWETSSSPGVFPTPGSPGLAVGAVRLAGTHADDDQWWQTDLAMVDSDYNWQLARFDVTDIDLGSVRELTFTWKGHGEPTPGYATAAFLWDVTTASWKPIAEPDVIGTDTPISHTVTVGDASSLCLRCHGDTLMPNGGSTEVASLASWYDPDVGDYHGVRSGDVFGTYGAGESGLKVPYERGDAAAIPCSVCHDAHGTSSIYHIPGNVNGAAGLLVTSGTELTNLCASCHVGLIDQWHGPCGETCHTGDGSTVDQLPTETSDCTVCHGHGTTWTHQDTGYRTF